jgi:hypothetical protein
MIGQLHNQLDSWHLAALWLFALLLCMLILVRDLRRNNPEISGLMRLVWLLTVLYSGPLGLAVYWFSGRKQISRDTIWRRGWRSVSHCYSGCGAGELIGVLITVGLLAWPTWQVSLTTFVLAYLFGYGLTVGPLMQEGVALRQALWDAFTSESASITVMEVVAIGVDQLLAPQAAFEHAIFWNSLVVSLSCGLVAAWPVNVLLIRLGIKAGMHDPREMAAHSHPVSDH